MSRLGVVFRCLGLVYNCSRFWCVLLSSSWLNQVWLNCYSVMSLCGKVKMMWKCG